MRKFPFLPTSASYAVDYGAEAFAVKLDGGLSRYRRDIIGSSKLVEASWQFGPGEFQYFEAFYRTATEFGSEPFLLDLIIDEAIPVERTCNFVPGTKRLDSQSGLTYIVSVRLEIAPKQYSADYDNSLLDLMEFYGSLNQIDTNLNLLEKLVNIDFDVT